MDLKRNIKYSLNSYGKDKKFYQIRIIVSFNGERLYLTTGCNVKSLNAWDSEEKRIRKGYPSVKGVKSEVQNATLQRAMEIINDCFKYHEVNKTIPEISDIKEYYEEKFLNKIRVTDKIEEVEDIKKKQSFWDIYDVFLSQEGTKNMWSESTYKIFNTLRRDLYLFKKRISFEDLTDKWLIDFITYLRDEVVVIPPKSTLDESGEWKGKRVGLNNSTIKKKWGYLRRFLNWATTAGYNTNTSFLTFKFNFKIAQKPVIYLTKEEMQSLLNMEIPPQKMYLERTRDIFLFCCFSGLRHSDARNLKRTDIKDGKIMITTIKTIDSLIIELNDVTQAILDKYKNYTFKGNAALPVPCNQTLNRWLKELAKIAGLDKPIRRTSYVGKRRIDEVIPKYKLISSHVGRKTFCCQALSNGIQSDIVMKWTGHKDYKAMKPYIDIVDQAKEQAMQKMNGLLNIGDDLSRLND